MIGRPSGAVLRDGFRFHGRLALGELPCDRENFGIGQEANLSPIGDTLISIAMREGVTLNATQQSSTIMQIANLATMTVETQISEADVGKVYRDMPVYYASSYHVIAQ